MYEQLVMSEEDKQFLEWQVYLSHKICEVFGISQQELMSETVNTNMVEDTRHFRRSCVSSVPHFGFKTSLSMTRDSIQQK